jgi:hypothetical protein
VTACQKSDTAVEQAASEQSKPVATIDGRPVTPEFFEFYAKTRSGTASSEHTDEQRKALLDEIVRLELAAQTALKSGLDQQPETASQLELQRMTALADAAFKKHLDRKTPAEQNCAPSMRPRSPQCRSSNTVPGTSWSIPSRMR